MTGLAERGPCLRSRRNASTSPRPTRGRGAWARRMRARLRDRAAPGRWHRSMPARQRAGRARRAAWDGRWGRAPGGATSMATPQRHRKRRARMVMVTHGPSGCSGPRTWRARLPWPPMPRGRPSGQRGASHAGHCFGRTSAAEGGCATQAARSRSQGMSRGLLAAGMLRSRRPSAVDVTTPPGRFRWPARPRTSEQVPGGGGVAVNRFCEAEPSSSDHVACRKFPVRCSLSLLRNRRLEPRPVKRPASTPGHGPRQAQGCASSHARTSAACSGMRLRV